MRSQNISNGAIDRSEEVFVQPPDDTEARRTRITNGDVLISVTGEPGKVAVADEDLGEAFVSQHVALVRLRDWRASSFVGMYLSGPRYNRLKRKAYGQTRPGLNLYDVADAMVALPCPHERAVIAVAGRGLDSVVKWYRAALEALIALKKSTAGALLTGRLRVANTEV